MPSPRISHLALVYIDMLGPNRYKIIIDTLKNIDNFFISMCKIISILWNDIDADPHRYIKKKSIHHDIFKI